ncbi:unnamed protein product [Strongylus vulgaris]|uniref:Protein-tyrosine sulfotransferase n=1 Tax=Strongylus vulgaris TaxID=40348 RepID=A0A3P7JIJ7_STRVU|nr:unnamed protein product [Strongylus vulgaris]
MERNRLNQAGLNDEVLKRAVGSFVIQVLVGQGPVAPRLCCNDPPSLNAAEFLATVFPNARFIFMIRDGRAVVHDILSGKSNVQGYNMTNYRECMKHWNDEVEEMNQQCEAIGNKCLKVMEPSTVNKLSTWVKAFPDDVLRDAHKIAPMLEKLGYRRISPHKGYAEEVSSQKAGNKENR